MEAETTTLADELRQIARNLDRAAGISAQYCASGHHTAAIRRAADELEGLGRVEAAAMALLDVLEPHRAPTPNEILPLLDALAARPAATPDPDRHHVDEIRRIMAADRPGGGA